MTDPLLSAPPAAQSAATRAIRAAASANSAAYSTAFDKSERAVGFPFSIEAGTNRMVLVLSEPRTIVVHCFATEIQKGDNGQYARRGYARCLRRASDASGNVVDTGAACPGCVLFDGIAPMNLLWFLVDDFGKPYMPKKTERNPNPVEVKHPIRTFQTTQAAVMSQVADQIEGPVAAGILSHCLMRVTRSAGGRSPRCGDSLTVMKRTDAATLQAQPYWPEILAGLRERDPALMYVLDADAMLAAAPVHVRHCNTLRETDLYSEPGWTAIQNGTWRTFQAGGPARTAAPTHGPVGDPLGGLLFADSASPLATLPDLETPAATPATTSAPASSTPAATAPAPTAPAPTAPAPTRNPIEDLWRPQ